MKGEISFKDIVEAIIKSRWMLLIFFAIAAAIAVYFYAVAPKSYTADATIWPIAGSENKMAEFLAGTALGMLTHAETKANILLVVLGSQTLAENVLRNFNIVSLVLGKPQAHPDRAQLEEAARRLRAKIMRFSVSKDGSIVVSASLSDQDRVSGLVNCYLEELAVSLNKNAINMDFTVIDRAQRPLKPSAPDLVKNLVVSFGIAFFFSLVYVAFNLLYFKKS